MPDIRDFLEKYGEKGYLLLKAIVEESKTGRRGPAPGDFSFKGLKARIASYGIDYNPSILLAKLEREYGLIETSFRSSNQHWWRIRDRRLLERLLRSYEGVDEHSEDPRVRVLKVQFWSLDPHKILATLEKIASSPRPRYRDRDELRKIAFEALPLIARFLEESRGFEELLEEEVALAEDILDAAERALEALKDPGYGRPAKGLRTRAALDNPLGGGFR